ncbi:hypothetical protein [Planctomyces sp. SH-PL62]|uniref:hypothetical protein n=1 Tax=Planctomyces sp. SH-PL62 TaxID=1636152 RepID=UPI00078B1892|nr:hypothetical protein [Planctomyces sp. SH-PL62]AMV37705.1 hypothetical protein VT85_09730 [Planctomyces sp. SH-PL62]
MQGFFAYFGPEVQMPLASLLASIVGMVMIAGAAPLRVAKRLWARVAPAAARRGPRG